MTSYDECISAIETVMHIDNILMWLMGLFCLLLGYMFGVVKNFDSLK